MSQFFRFPHTPHLSWLGKGRPRDDKVLSPAEASAFLLADVVVEEKIDGANIGISLDEAGMLRVQNRGQFLAMPYRGQFSRLEAWLAQYEISLKHVLANGTILFGEWCAAKHSLAYDRLPDWFLLFDVYQEQSEYFWSTDRRNQLAREAGLCVVHKVSSGRFNLNQLKKMLEETKSKYRDGLMEGLVLRKETKSKCEARAKLVSADFSQSIDEHWRSRTIEWNRVVATHN